MFLVFFFNMFLGLEGKTWKRKKIKWRREWERKKKSSVYVYGYLA